MLVHFPVAALMGLVASDAAFIYTGDPFWARLGLWLAGVGTLGGWVAALIGLLDWLVVRRIRDMISASIHGILAITVLSLAAFNWHWRLEDAAAAVLPWGIYLSVLTAVMITATSVLGGILVYDYGVGVDMEP
ncbi:MAG: DUF2231 domain-containing protein [Chromatocurvus sp.]